MKEDMGLRDNIGASSNNDGPRGDYQLLCESVGKKREDVRMARLHLGIDLHRLGEYHMRKREYHEAMGAFSEALVEKRSVVSFSFDTEDKPLSSMSSHVDASIDQRCDSGQVSEYKSVNEVVSTLSCLGTVHSLIGEHNEAMKCYSEITAIRTSLSLTQVHTASQSGHEDEDTDASDLDEEVNALDDLFRNISFRNGASKQKDISKSCQQFIHHSPTPEKSHDNLTLRKEMKRDDLQSYRPWDQLNSSMEDFHDTIEECKKIGCSIDLNEFSHIEKQVETLKNEYQNNLTLQAKLEAMREKCLYMTLLVRDKLLQLHQIIAAFYFSKKDESEPSQENNTHYITASNNVAATMISIGGIHYKLSNLNEELHMYQQALMAYQSVHGDYHPFVAGTRKNIGMVLVERFDFDGAMEQFEIAKEIYAKNKGSSICSHVASTISCMGNVEYRRGDLDIALSLFSKALYIFRTLGEESGWSNTNITNVTSTLKIIGMAYTKRSDLDSAMKCYEEAMELMTSQELQNGVESASIYSRIGGILYRKGQFDEAMNYYMDAYAVSLESLGTKHHPDIASILHFIGIVHQRRSRLDDAMASYQESIQIYRSTLGPDNPARATTTVYIGSIYFRKGEYNEALECYMEALRLYETSFGPNHPQVGPTMKSIAMIHIKKEEYDEAMEIFQDLLRRKCVILGSSHPDIAYAHKCIGNIHLKLKELGNALRQYKHAYEIYQRTLGDNHKETKAMKKTISNIRHNLMVQQQMWQKKNSESLIDRRAYKHRKLSASRYAY